MFEINKIKPEEVKGMTLEEIVKNVIEPDIRKKSDDKSKDNIENRTPETYGELMQILIKEHEETFKGITLEAQLDKFVDEQEEFEEAKDCLNEARELADMVIVAAGIARFAPRFVKEFLMPAIIKVIEEQKEYGKGMITDLALEKSLINKSRDWSKKGGKYQHK